MSKSHLTAFISSLTLTVIILISVNTDKAIKPERAYKSEYKPDKIIEPTATPTPSPTPTPNPTIIYYQDVIKPNIDSIPLELFTLELESLGKHFITAYCPSECGYNGSNYPKGWTTATDTICFRASHENRYTEPTTCAIDPKIYRFGKLFYIKEFDRVFIARDTGSAVKGKHLDLFYEEYSDVLSFPTGYYTVYSVDYNYYTIPANKYDVRKWINQKLIDKRIPRELQ